MAVGNVSADATPCVLCYSIRLDSKRAVPGDADGRRSDGDETRRNHGEETIGRSGGGGKGGERINERRISNRFPNTLIIPLIRDTIARAR